MDFSNTTPKKEITISKQVLTVISPYSEGHTLTAEEANVLNQTLAENLRNNFAPRVKAVVDEAEKNGAEVDVAALQAELDEYIAGYSFGVRRGGGAVVVDPVKKIALGLARDAVKKALVAKGKSLKDYTAETIADLAEGVLERNPSYMESAASIHAQKKAAAAISLGDLLD